MCFLERFSMDFEKESIADGPSALLRWSHFFDELNMHIAMYNLRILSQSLESFKRQKQLEMI